MATTLVVNPGSSSKKYALFIERRCVLDMRFEKTSNGYVLQSEQSGVPPVCQTITKDAFMQTGAAVAAAVSLVCTQAACPLTQVVLRVVAPGTFFQQHRRIDGEYITKLKTVRVTDPLHIPVILDEIQMCVTSFPAVDLIAASDSAFHATMPVQARSYSLAPDEAKRMDMFRFGYHGLSVASVARRLATVCGKDVENVIVCHIGSGCSVTALKGGVSVETSMGFSPLSGLPMGTRAAELDAGSVLEVMRQKNLTVANTMQYLYEQGGLVGLAGDADIRVLLDRAARDEKTAVRALEYLAYHLKQYIGAYTAVLGGLDAVVCTGTAAYRSPALRRYLFGDMAHLGIVLDEDKNEQAASQEAIISTSKSRVLVAIARCDEMMEMAAVAQEWGL